MICWQFFVALWRMFLDAGGFLLLGKSVLSLWKVCGPVRLCRQSPDTKSACQVALSFTDYHADFHSTEIPTASPTILVVTQTSFATVTSIVTALVENSPSSLSYGNVPTLVQNPLAASAILYGSILSSSTM